VTDTTGLKTQVLDYRSLRLRADRSSRRLHHLEILSLSEYFVVVVATGKKSKRDSLTSTSYISHL
jgi:hypothetical protein